VSRSAGVEKSKNKSASGCDPCCGKDPAAEAKGWQGSAPYYGTDKWSNTVIKKGTTIYTLTPYGKVTPGFFAAQKTYMAAGGNANVHNRMLQVAHSGNSSSL
jgi:hypothetical protein